MRDPTMERQARVMSVAAVLVLRAIEKGQWNDAERALVDLSLLTSRLRSKVSPRASRPASAAERGNVVLLTRTRRPVVSAITERLRDSRLLLATE